MLNNRNLQETSNPVVESTAKAEPKNRLLVVSKNGRIGCSIRDTDDNVEVWEAEYPYGTKKSTVIANILHELNYNLSIIERDKDDYKYGFVIGLFDNVYGVLTNMEIISKQLMFNKAFVSHTKESEEVIPEIKTWKTREFSAELAKEYREFLQHMLNLLGFVTFTNSRYISDKKNPYWKGLRAKAFSAIDEDDEDDEELAYKASSNKTPSGTTANDEYEDEE